MRTIKVLPSFERSLKRLSADDKNKLKKTLHQFNNFLLSHSLSKGLGLKKLIGGIYELRIDIRLRIIVKMDEEIVYFVLVGSHADIKHYLKRIR